MMRKIYKGDGYFTSGTLIFILSVVFVLILPFWGLTDIIGIISVLGCVILLNLFVTEGPFCYYIIIDNESIIIQNLWWFWVDEKYTFKEIVNIEIYEILTHSQGRVPKLYVKTRNDKHKYSMKPLTNDDFIKITQNLKEKNVDVINKII